MKIEFNINEYVKVKLTDAGRKELKKQHTDLYSRYHQTIPEYQPPKEDEEGYSKWQLWHLMSTFGDKLYLGCPNMFELDIRIIGDYNE
jgi:hypothetical protein